MYIFIVKDRIPSPYTIIRISTCTSVYAQLTARSQLAVCHSISFTVVACTCPGSQEINAKRTRIRVRNWCYRDRHCISFLSCGDCRARGIIDIQHICPIRGGHSTVSGNMCIRIARDGEKAHSLSWLNVQITAYLHVHYDKELLHINWRRWVNTLKYRWTCRWRYARSQYSAVAKLFCNLLAAQY